MRILVIDDNPLHLDSARQTLGDHELTIVGTYDEAHKLLQEPRVSQEEKYAEIKRRGITGNPMTGATTEEERKAFWEEYKRVETELRPPPPSFDVVLSDLLMPASRMTMGDKGKEYVGQEMPVGFALALMAVLHGTRHVAVVTDSDHHDHPASAMLDSLSAERWHDNPRKCPVKFEINGARVGYFHSPMIPIEGTMCSECAGTGKYSELKCKFCDGSGKSQYVGEGACGCCRGSGHRENVKCDTCTGSGKQQGKDWGKVLARLLGTDSARPAELA